MDQIPMPDFCLADALLLLATTNGKRHEVIKKVCNRTVNRDFTVALLLFGSYSLLCRRGCQVVCAVGLGTVVQLFHHWSLPSCLSFERRLFSLTEDL